MADPYRVLGLLRGADPEEVKSAYRQLAKRYHPDGSTGDELRFLAVQEAYQLLSDPARRREWDRAHAPGPVRAASVRRHRGKTRPGGNGARRPTVRTARTARGVGGPSRTWSATHVPWWQDFRRESGPGESGSSPDQDEPSGSDVFDRSSGAAWSAAARRHFRRGTDDLPSRGVWRYRGTQVVTGAEARKVAAEDEEEESRR